MQEGRAVGRTGWHPADAALPFESAGPHNNPAPFFGRISADLAHKGGRRSRSEITEKHPDPPSWGLWQSGFPDPLPVAPLPPRRRSVRCSCGFSLLACRFHFSCRSCTLFSGTWLTPWSVHHGHPPGEQKNVQDVHLTRRGRESLAGLKHFQLATRPADSTRALCSRLSKTGFAPRQPRSACDRPPLGLGMLWVFRSS